MAEPAASPTYETLTARVRWLALQKMEAMLRSGNAPAGELKMLSDTLRNMTAEYEWARANPPAPKS
jgi:hypothetical protein